MKFKYLLTFDVQKSEDSPRAERDAVGDALSTHLEDELGELYIESIEAASDNAEEDALYVATVARVVGGAPEKVPGHIWCDTHGDVHEPKSDPYSDGTKCAKRDWRTLWMEAGVDFEMDEEHAAMEAANARAKGEIDENVRDAILASRA